MNKFNYELESLVCLFESNTRIIEELENYYKTNPYDHIKDRIIARLHDQKELLKKINNCGFSKHYFDTFILNKKYAKYSRNSKKVNTQVCKVINSKKVPKSTFKFATSLLIASLIIFTPSSSCEKNIDKEEFTINLYDKLAEMNLLTKKTVEVQMPNAIGSQRQLNCNTIEIKNKHYDIKCSEELQDYFYELEEKWEIPASLAMLIVDKESEGQWNTNGVISTTNDYGLAQINICNHKEIINVLGYTSNDLRNDPYKNLDAMFYLLTKIFNLYGYTKENYDIENICGTYNGYINWRDKEQSLTYVKDCIKKYNEIFVDNQDKEKILVRSTY